MALDDRNRSQVMADANPLGTEQISEYASLNPYTRSWETPRGKCGNRADRWKRCFWSGCQGNSCEPSRKSEEDARSS